MTCRAVTLFLGLVAAAVVPAGADPIRLKAGRAAVDGTVSFTLTHTGSNDSVAIEVPIPAGTGAWLKAYAIKNAVAAAGPAGTWYAYLNLWGTLTFWHLNGWFWQEVDVISDLTDTTGSGTQFATACPWMDFRLRMDSEATATSVNPAGDPSFITVSVTDTLTWTRPIRAGDTPRLILDSFETFLREQGGSGVSVARLSSSELSVQLRYDQSQFGWHITDTGLASTLRGSGLPGILIGVIDRDR